LEIIIVDDRSTDSTPEILQKWTSSYAHIKSIRIDNTPQNFGPKKYALARGIHESTGELLFFTDADCRPPVQWVEKITRCFDNDVGLVAGFAPLVSTSNKILQKILEFDTLASAFVAAAGISANRPITCNGRNLAYRREAYEQVGGFKTFAKWPAGDDDLFMHETAKQTQWKFTYSTDPETFVPSAAPGNIKDFIRQRRRHYSASMYYPLRVKAGYFLAHMSSLLIFSLFICSLILNYKIFIFGIVLTAKFVIDACAIAAIAGRLKQKFLIRLLFLWEFFSLAANVLIGPLSFFGKIKWR